MRQSSLTVPAHWLTTPVTSAHQVPTAPLGLLPPLIVTQATIAMTMN